MLRIATAQELIGLDRTKHGGSAYGVDPAEAPHYEQAPPYEDMRSTNPSQSGVPLDAVITSISATPPNYIAAQPKSTAAARSIINGEVEVPAVLASARAEFAAVSAAAGPPAHTVAAVAAPT